MTQQGTIVEIIQDSLKNPIQTDDIILFSAAMTEDNVPLSNLTFYWDWGDGSPIESGQGMYLAHHGWTEGSNSGTIYNLTLTVNDSINQASITVEIPVINRLPRQIFDDTFIVDTYTT